MKKRADGRYVRCKEYAGKGRKYFFGYSEDEVIAKQNAFEKSLNEDAQKRTTLNHWADEWWEAHQQEIKYNTVQCYIKPLDDIKTKFGDKFIAEIKASEIKAFFLDMKKENYARQTVKLRQIVLSQIYDFAIENDIAIPNIAKAIKIPNNLKTKKVSGISKDEIKTIKDSEDLFANFLLFTGTRRNEALAIKWENIDFKNNTINIDSALVWVNNKPVVESTKTTSGLRTIPLLNPLKKLLQKQKKQSGYIFNINGLPLEKKHSATAWNKFKAKTNLDITAHQLRHTFITNMFYGGIDVKTAQSIAGHSRVETMLNIYTDLNKNNQKETLEKLNKFMK